ncbi:hypothetical protein GQ53DRAFT_656746 [Thozetella sp. PMI_491]|nr:hypothetical protein GQ53DRAFT_656746 [Thozetella sp. PMI_491]
MRSTAIVTAASLAFGLSRACEVLDDVKTTFYGTNDSPGGKVAYDCGDRNYLAQGDGSFSNPLTFGGDLLSYLPCQLIYSPYLRKYLRMEDNCKQCIKDANKGIRHIAIWSAQAPNSCEDELTPTAWQDVVLDPPGDLAVDSKEPLLYRLTSC